MGSFSSFAVLLLVLFAYGTNAARLYPTGQEAVAAPGVFLGMQVNTHDFCKTMFTVAKQ
jgi:hypothetical protein